MNEEKPRRRWFRYSLRTFFFVLTVFGVWLAWEHRVIAERREVRRWIKDHDGYTWSVDNVRFEDPRHKPGRIPLIRQWLGDEAITVITLPHGMEEADPEGFGRARRAFPEAEFQGHGSARY